MNKRAQAVEDTRRRILEAVVQLHGDKGIVATTWEDIAQRADVALATVYRHFPSLDQLVPACGQRVAELTSPPSPAIFEGQETLCDRIAALVRETFAYYGRAGASTAKALCDAPRVPVLAAIMEERGRAFQQLARQALGELAERPELLRLTLALTDYYFWKAFAQQGLEEEAAGLATEVLLSRAEDIGPHSGKV